MTARDPDGDPVRFARLTGPVGTRIDDNAGTLLRTPDASQLGIAAVRVSATAAYGAGTNHSPWRDDIQPRFAAVGVPYAGTINGSDPDNDALYYSVDQASYDAGIGSFNNNVSVVRYVAEVAPADGSQPFRAV